MNIFKNFVIANELHVGESGWRDIVNQYSQEFIIQQISDAIELFEIKLPYRNVTIEEVNEDYLKLKSLRCIDLIKDGNWGNKFQYKYSLSPQYVDLSNAGNKASDYFHQTERWKCDATGYPSPEKTWKTEKFRLTLFKALFSLKVKEINPQVLRTLISLRKYIAAQFRPSAAKAIYDLLEPESVLDFSMGWGDRIAGAHASNTVKRYVGIDPNKNLFDGYLKQIDYYKSIDDKEIHHRLICGCAEDENINLFNEKFDLIFTSPPYFDKEKYDQSDDQSYKKYKGFDSWMKDFLFKTIELRSQNLKSGGDLIINVSDIYTRKKLYQICDGMNDYINSTNQFEYIGCIGLRMPKRPQSISSDTIGMYGEPIWWWRKK